MSGDLRQRLGAIIEQALAAPFADRPRIVHDACDGDKALEAEATSLLAAIGNAGGFLQQPTVRNGAGGGGGAAPISNLGPGLHEGPGATIGRYKLLQQIGEGGFGIVFMAEQREPVRRRVALKIIKLGMDTRQVVARFEAERQALAMMDHPNIAKVLDGGATETGSYGGGRPYFVMELVAGESIVTYCDRHTLPATERLELFAQVCRAVQHAHTKGVIHRDLKPGNVLVSIVDGRPVPKVIDFGIAKATHARLTEKTVFTEFRQLIGTPEYMSPEQAEPSGQDIDARTDIYSLGVLLYELLTGVTPFDPERLRSAAWGELQRIIREDEPQKPSTRISSLKDTIGSIAARRHTEPGRLAALVRGDLDWIVMRCLEKDRARRYPTADALAEDVRRHLRGDAVLAAPPSAPYRLRKFVRRHRGAVAAGSLVALALCAGIIGTSIGFFNAAQERRAAVNSEARATTKAAQSDRIAEFLADMLKGVRPAVAQGRDTTVLREIVDRTAARIDQGELKNDPQVEARLRRVLGNLSSDLDQHAKAEAHLREAVRLSAPAFGPRSEEAAESMNDLATALWTAEKFPEAEQLLRASLDIRRRVFGDAHDNVGRSLNNLAMLLQEHDDAPGAEKALREALDIRRRALGVDHEEIADTLSNLAMVLYNKGDFAAAEAPAREAVAIDRKRRGPQSPDLATHISNLAYVDSQIGNLDQAEAGLREALAIRSAVLDPDHILIADSLENLAIVQQKRGAHADAADLFRRAITVTDPKGADVRTQRIQSSLAESLLADHRAPEAEAVLRECIRLRDHLFPDGHPLTWTRYQARALLARALTDQARFADAEPFAVAAGDWVLAHPSNSPENAQRAAKVIAQVAEFFTAWDRANPGSGHDQRAQAWAKRIPTAPPAVSPPSP